MFEDQKPLSRLALKVGIAGFIGFGAIATGMFMTRKGRHLVREAWEGRERTRIEDRVLDTWWSDPRFARRRIDVREIEPGHIEISGVVHSVGERRRVIELTKTVKGVAIIDDHLEVVARDKHGRSLRAPAVFDAVTHARRTRSGAETGLPSADDRDTKSGPTGRSGGVD